VIADLARARSIGIGIGIDIGCRWGSIEIERTGGDHRPKAKAIAMAIAIGMTAS